MRLGLNITKRGSLVIRVAPPEPTTKKRLSHSIASIGFLRANCRLIWATPRAIARPIDRAILWVSRYNTRKRMVEAKSRSSIFPACKKYFIVRSPTCEARASMRDGRSRVAAPPDENEFVGWRRLAHDWEKPTDPSCRGHIPRWSPRP